MLAIALRGHLVFLAMIAAACHSKPKPEVGPPGSIPSIEIASGTQRWVETMPTDPLLNAKVDIGSLRSVGNEIEYLIEFPMVFGTRAALLEENPSLEIPEGATVQYRERVTCTAKGPVNYPLARRLVASDGREIERTAYDVDKKRAEAQAPSKLGSHGPNPRSFVCWAGASKCQAKALVWPPPPNKTPLEHSARADKMDADYNAQFMPACPLGPPPAK